ncbi:hypothetical protein BaRGS_00034755 [Batillaria attramentaria]|uniref:VLRF1 domain-containing protein n=1 Tax=Batillaria attramentaria TaxID=370345 RepID=A0ABD0JH70_9CAEN
MACVKASSYLNNQQLKVLERMAQSSANKLPRKKVSSYSSCLLSDTKPCRQLLASLSIATCNPSVEDDEPDNATFTTKGAVEGEVKVTHTVSTRMSCGCCAVTFSGRSEQRAHFKSDWHRYNLKQKLRGEEPITEEAFESLSGDISSISGSDDSSDSSSETDDARPKPSPLPARVHKSTQDSTDSDSEGASAVLAATRKHPKLFLRNSDGQLVSLYRCLLYHKKSCPTTQAELLSLASKAVDYTRVAVIMLAGGHFAAAVFDGNQAVVHKTFHRYVVRAKRGTAQSTRDSQGNAPKSGGASLRRYNEAALALEIQELLTSWSEQMKNCHLIFLRTSTYSKQIFFGGKAPALDKNDLRVRTIPFSTCRPTFNEVKRVHQMLTSVECYGDESTVVDFVPVSPPRHINRNSGQLEIQPDTLEKRSPQRRKDKGQAFADTKTETGHAATDEGGNAVVENTAADVEEKEQSDVEVELVEQVVEVYTEELKYDETEVELKNKLYTACRCGNLDTLSQLLDQLCHSSSPQQVASETSHADGGQSGDHLVLTGTRQPYASSETNSDIPVLSEQCNSGRDTSGPTGSCSDSKNEEKDERGTADNSLHLTSSVSEGGRHTGGSGQERSSGINSVGSRPRQLLNEGHGEKRSTLLHVASVGGHADLVHTLLEAGCDPAVKDAAGKPPYAVAGSKETRNIFRRFRGNNPDMYNYEAAQIPSALTDEMEAEKKQREAERKKAQRKARQERLKEKKAEEAKVAAEQREKQRFLSLSDREKRALAAERRLLQQASDQGSCGLVLSRCYQCGGDMTGKVPFEYMDFKFCTPKCLKEHRAKNTQ